VSAAVHRARPKVLENFRRNAKVQDAARDVAFRELLENSRPYEALDTVLMWPLANGDSDLAARVLADKVAEHAGSNQYMFFHRLFVEEPRAVTTSYYLNALRLLGALCLRPELAYVDYPHPNGKKETPIVSLFVKFAELLLSHFESRPELRVIWNMEALVTRLTKRMLLSSPEIRRQIAGSVEMQRFFTPEERTAYMGPSPARTIVQVMDSVPFAEIGLFFNRHYRNPARREFDVRGAVEEYERRRRPFEAYEDATRKEYDILLAGLSGEWKELSGADSINRVWDRLGHGACDVLLHFPSLLPNFPDRLRERLAHLAQLGNGFARRCAESLGTVVPDGDFPHLVPRLEALFDSDPRRSATDAAPAAQT
jgi:hypothetical protein